MHRLVLPLFVVILGVATVHGFLVSPVLRSRKTSRQHAAGNEARGCAIAIIVVHGIHLLAFGFLLPTTWVASLIAFIMGGVHLCMFQKCTYICAGVFYILGAIIDIVTLVISASAGAIIFAVPAALGMIGFVLGAVFSLVAVCKWELSGAPATAGTPGPTVVQANAPIPAIQVTTAHRSELPANSWNVNAAPKASPPPYSGNV